MKAKRSWDEVHLGPRPLLFAGWDDLAQRPSTFRWEPIDFQPPKVANAGKLYYRNGWTAVIFWNHGIYFADEILTFEDMLNLIEERFHPSYLRNPVTRDHHD